MWAEHRLIRLPKSIQFCKVKIMYWKQFMSWRREGSLFSTLNTGIKARNSTETKLPRSIFDHELSKLFFSFSFGYLWKFLSFIFPQSYQRLCDLPFRSTSLSSSVKITSIYANTRSHTISKWLKQVDYEENMRGARTRTRLDLTF